jgi:hypothetical protein
LDVPTAAGRPSLIGDVHVQTGFGHVWTAFLNSRKIFEQ